MQPKQIAKKLRKCLLDQKERLENYLHLITFEEEDIIKKDPDKLIAHIEVEKNIINELKSFKKLINPLEEMYFNSPYRKDSSLIDIKKSIKHLTGQIVEKTEKNQEKLSVAMDEVKAELKGIKKKKVVNSAYDKVESKLVDVCG